MFTLARVPCTETALAKGSDLSVSRENVASVSIFSLLCVFLCVVCVETQ